MEGASGRSTWLTRTKSRYRPFTPRTSRTRPSAPSKPCCGGASVDWLIVALIAGLAFLAGNTVGFHNGLRIGEETANVRRRIAELPKPWERP